MTRPAPPDLEFTPPACPICGKETAAGDGFSCYSCNAFWDEDGAAGAWHFPDAAQCTSTTFNTWTNLTHRCILGAHMGFHQCGCGHVGWNDDHADPTPTNIGVIPCVGSA